MNENEKNVGNPAPRFHTQWDEYIPAEGQVFVDPSLTIPDQSMTIPEIIARFTRTGQLPGTFKMADQGGNVAADPESDPLDDFFPVQAAAAAARAAEAERAAGPPGEADKDLPNGGAGEAGEA